MDVNGILPNSAQLSKLPLRAIFCYASRAVRRILSSQNLGHIVAFQNVLQLIDDVVRSQTIPADAQSRVAFAAADVCRAAKEEPIQTLTFAMSVVDAASCCMFAVPATRSGKRDPAARLAKAARSAVMAASMTKETEYGFAVADYEMLVKLFGNQDSGVLGDAFDPSEGGPLGPLKGDARGQGASAQAGGR